MTKRATPRRDAGRDAKRTVPADLYLAAVDDLLRHPDDRPTIGLLLCKSKDRVVVEYALRGFNKPIGVAEWETTMVETLPAELRGTLPTIEEIEAELVDRKVVRPVGATGQPVS